MEYMLKEKLIWRTLSLTLSDAAERAGMDLLPVDEARYNQLLRYAESEFFFPTEQEALEQELHDAGPSAEEVVNDFEERKLERERIQLEKIFDPEGWAARQEEIRRAWIEDLGDSPF